MRSIHQSSTGRPAPNRAASCSFGRCSRSGRRCPVAPRRRHGHARCAKRGGVKRQRHRAAQGAEIQLQRFIGCHGVRSLWGKERSASAGSGRPSVNKPKPARPRFSAWWPPAARAIPGDSSGAPANAARQDQDGQGRCCGRCSSEARPATARHPPQRWNYPQGIALLASMGVHFTALPACSLAGEQISQPLDVLPGDFWWHRLTLRLGRRCGWWPFVWLSGCRWRVFLCPGIELTVDGPLDDAEQIPCGIADAGVATTRGPFVQHVLPQRGSTCCNATLAPACCSAFSCAKRLGHCRSPSARACAVVRISLIQLLRTVRACFGFRRDVWRVSALLRNP